MHAINDTSDMDGYVDWVVDVLKWGTLVDDTASAEGGSRAAISDGRRGHLSATAAKVD